MFNEQLIGQEKRNKKCKPVKFMRDTQIMSGKAKTITGKIIES